MKNFLLIGIISGISFSVSAQLVNGGLETDFTGWQTIGNGTSDTAAVNGNGPQPMIISSFGTSIVPQEGVNMAQVANGGSVNLSSIETFAGVTSGTIQGLQTYPATFGGAIKQKFYGTVNSVISFDEIFTTTDGTYASDTTQWSANNYMYDDFAFCTIKSSTTQYAERISDFKTMQFDSMHVGGSHFFNGHFAYNSWRVFIYQLPVTDTFTITIGIMNCGDNLAASDLLVDNVSLYSTASIQENQTNSPLISVFPNPANDVISITASNEKNLFELFSSDGKLVKSESLERNEKTEINVADLSEGFYFYKITGEKIYSGRLAITR